MNNIEVIRQYLKETKDRATEPAIRELRAQAIDKLIELEIRRADNITKVSSGASSGTPSGSYLR
jgi:hypothetical protein